ncbi:MAG: exosome complex RNA-binding protein Csl4 [Thermoplasmatota archaeon]
MAERALVFPGDEVATAEEFLPGAGTYEENGTVYAARLGFVKLDATEFKASVEPVTSVPMQVQAGDMVIGTVESIRSSMAIVQVQRVIREFDREVGGDTNGTLHISRAAEYYLPSLEDAFRVKDIIRAEVISADPSIQLSTRAPHLGAVKCYCPRDRRMLERQGDLLVCPECEMKLQGKVAEDYGSGHVAFQGVVRPVEDAPPRREGPGGGGRRGGGFGGGRGGGMRGGRGGGRDHGDRRGGGSRGGGGRRYEGGRGGRSGFGRGRRD